MAEEGCSSVLTGEEEIPLPQFPPPDTATGSELTTPRRQQQKEEEETATDVTRPPSSFQVPQGQQQPFVSRRVYEERVYVQPKTIVEEQVIEVPQVEYRDCIVETPETVFLEKVRAVPRLQIQERVIHVPKPITKEVAIEVPQIQWQEKFVEVPTPVFQEKVIPVPKPVVREQVVYVPRPVIEEKTVEVPRVVYRPLPIEKVVEVPEYQCVYKYNDVQLPPQQVFVTVPSASSPPALLEGGGVRTLETPRGVGRGREEVTRGRLRLRTSPARQPINLNVVVKKGQTQRSRKWALGLDSSSLRSRESMLLNLFECCSAFLTPPSTPRTPTTRSSSVSPRVRYMYYPVVGEKGNGGAVSGAGRKQQSSAASTPRFYSKPAVQQQQQQPSPRVRYASAPPPPRYYYYPATIATAAPPAATAGLLPAATAAGGLPATAAAGGLPAAAAAAGRPAAAGGAGAVGSGAAVMSPRVLPAQQVSPREVSRTTVMGVTGATTAAAAGTGVSYWNAYGAAVEDAAKMLEEYTQKHLPSPEPLIQTRVGVMRFVDFEVLNNTDALYAPRQTCQQQQQQETTVTPSQMKKTRSQEWPRLPQSHGGGKIEAAAAGSARQQCNRAAAGKGAAAVEEEGKTEEGKSLSIKGSSERVGSIDGREEEKKKQQLNSRGAAAAAAKKEGKDTQEHGSEGRNSCDSSSSSNVQWRATARKTTGSTTGKVQAWLPEKQQQQQFIQRWQWEQEKIDQERQRLEEATRRREQQLWQLRRQQQLIQQQLQEQQQLFEREQRELQLEQQRLRENIRRRQYENLTNALQTSPLFPQFAGETRGRLTMPAAFTTIRSTPERFPVTSYTRGPEGPPVASRLIAATPVQQQPAVSYTYLPPLAETSVPTPFYSAVAPLSPSTRPAAVAAAAAPVLPPGAVIATPRAAVAVPSTNAAAVPLTSAAATLQPAGYYRMYIVPHVGQPLPPNSVKAPAAKQSTAVRRKPVPSIPIDVSALRLVPAEPGELVETPRAKTSARGAAGNTTPAGRGREGETPRREQQRAAGDLSSEEYRKEVARQAQEAVQSAYLAGVCVYQSVREAVRKEIDAALTQESE